jgi:regulation of enolase protein 1 (concanavalin A-like superfamily)
MEWLNEPASWQRTGDVLTVSVDPGTDFWRETGYGYIRDSGHVYGEVLGGDLDVSVRVRCTLGVQYDQAGLMLRADERTWLKTGVEFFEGRPRLSTVLTLGRSSWMVTDLPAGTDDIVLRVSRRGDAVEVRYVLDDGPAELAALAFLPPGREVLAGVMGAAPEGPGFRVTFQDLRITERDWSAAPAGDDAGTRPAGQAGWTSDDTPVWSPATAEPSWTPRESDPGWTPR